MTTDEFDTFWQTRYSGTPPISHYFRYAYAERWFRIHSLPEAQRYAKTDADWKILLNRQNALITDLLAPNAPFLLVTGEYLLDEIIYPQVDGQLEPVLELPALASMEFTPAHCLNLHQLEPENYDEGHLYQPLFSEQVWRHRKFDNLLRSIADDQMRALFVDLTTDQLIAPYDGGVDIILPDSPTRDYYREKYHAWLSAREDGL